MNHKYIDEYEVEKLTPYVNNSRQHNLEQVNQVAASIKEFGFTNPVLIDNQDTIIAGHCRVMAAKKLELKKIPVVVLSDLSPAQRKAYVVADNQLALNAMWDFTKLSNEIEFLNEEEFNLDLLGFSESFLESLKITPDTEEGEVDYDEHWQDMPEFDQDDTRPHRTVMLHFLNQEDVDKFCDLTDQVITEKTKYVWFPEKQVDPVIDIHYE
ncbi:hypothetical protein CMK18_23845 [Candidatus Poribacteria bacterium]|nr:hypothetical protein [Candidatus Poribacteria bacterium]|tara:strand:- start:477 stop:1109 length:633 start_codon:yes stop_codon:yes gene_type:complete